MSGDYTVLQNAYWIDRDDRIIRASPLWDSFACDNDGERCVSASVIGKSIWTFVACDSPRMMMETLFRRARLTKNVIQKTYRCDSPDERRFMQMSLIPEDEDVIQVAHELVKTVPLTFQIHFKPAHRLSMKHVKRCAMCGRIRREQGWAEANTTMPLPISVIYGICDSCKIRGLSTATG